MSANWKNPFLNKDKMTPQQDISTTDMDAELKKHTKNVYSKDMRVSCEAIPEEISGLGTTPPSENVDHSGLLRFQYSCSGTMQSMSNTVPPSPTTIQVLKQFKSF